MSIFLLNRQNPLNVTKVICRLSKPEENKSISSSKVIVKLWRFNFNNWSIIRTRFPCPGFLDFLRNLFYKKPPKYGRSMGSDAIALNFLKKLDSNDKLTFHVSNLNTRVLDPPNLLHQFGANYGMIQYIWVTPKTNGPNFCLVLKLSHVLDGLFSVLSRLHGRKHNALFAEWRVISDIVAWNSFWHGQMEPTIYFQIYMLWRPLQCFSKYIFPQLQACSAGCSEGSCSSYIPRNFINFLVFNLPFFSFEQ